MNDTPHNQALSASARSILQDCRGVASRRLPGLVYEVLKQIKTDLMEIAPSTQKYELFALYREALDITQGRWSLIESRFRTHFLTGFDRESRTGTPTRPVPAAATVRRNTGNLDDFKLMDADDLEESLAVNTLANAIRSICVNELVALTPRMGTLLGDPDFERGENPLGADVIAEALMQTLQELDGSIKAKLVLVPMFSKYFPTRVQSVYQEVNQLLVKKGILPSLVAHVRKSPLEQPAQPQERQAASATGP